MKYFDEKATDWDDNPIHVKRAKVISEAILKSININKNMNALEYGCGTGLLSFFLYEKLNSLVLMDDSAEMLKVVRNKIRKNNVNNMKTVKKNLVKSKYSKKHDLIYTQMTLHHIKDIENIITIFYTILNKNGFLCIADLMEEDGSFHGHQKNFEGHNGFDPQNLQSILEKTGFVDINYSICYEMEKEMDQKKIKYPIFLMIGKK